MKKLKRIIGVLVFLAIGLTGTILASYVLRPAQDDFFRGKFTGFYAEEDNTLDVVGLGSSSLYRYFCSPLLYEYSGLTSYALSTAGQPILAIENLIDEIKKSQSPQLLVIESRKFLLPIWRTMREGRVRLVTDNMYYSANRISTINKLVADWKERLPYYFDIMVYHENWENVTLDSFFYMFNSKPHALKGWANDNMWRPLEKPDPASVTEELPLDPESEEALLGIMEKCKEENLEVLFVMSPFQIKPAVQAKANRLKRIVEEHGFQFLDGNLCADEMGIDYSTDFYNKKHTNSIGAGKFTKYLADYILEHYDLKIEHSPEVKASWDQAVAENQVIYDAACQTVLQRKQAAIDAAAAQAAAEAAAAQAAAEAAAAADAAAAQAAADAAAQTDAAAQAAAAG